MLFLYSGRGESNPTSSISTIVSFVSGDILTVDNDQGLLENAVNLAWFIRLIYENKKILSTTVNIGTSLELLGDVDVSAKTNGALLSYNSSTQLWEPRPTGYTPSYWRTYTLNATAGGVQPSPASANRNGVTFAYRIFDSGTGNTNMIIENKDTSCFGVFDSGFVFGILKTGFY